jgi:hypothetical protein
MDCPEDGDASLRQWLVPLTVAALYKSFVDII